MELNCKFEYLNWSLGRVDFFTRLYTCIVTVAEIDKPAGTVIRTFNGTHYRGKRHKDVKALYFDCCKMKHFPRGIQNIFRCLRGLVVHNCGLTTIARSDLHGLQSLEALYIQDNKLKSLPSNLLVGMSKLKIISFFSNQIEAMSSDILKPVMNNGLKFIDFESNGSLNALFWPGYAESVASIKELMKFIDKRCIKPTDDELIAYELSSHVNELFAPAVSGLWSKKFAVTVNAGSKKFRVHKFVLAMQSAKLAEMVEEHGVNEMGMTDFDEVVVEAFLRFFYTGDVPDDVDLVQLFELSSELGVTVLKTYCEEKILSNLGESNAFDVFHLGHAYANEEFKKQAFEEIRRMFPNVEIPDSSMEKPDELKQLIEARQYLTSVEAEFKKL